MAELTAREQLSKDCFDRLMLARTVLVLDSPFFGILASKLIPVEQNTWCRTLAVDGKHLYYNVEFIMGIYDKNDRAEYEQKLREALPDITTNQINQVLGGLSDSNVMAAICHEILHCAFNHFLRRGARDPKKWNRAADYAINQIIARDKKLGEIQSTWLYDPAFEGLTAEEIYIILEEEEQKNKSSSSKSGVASGSTLDQHDIPVQDDAPDLTEEEQQEYIEGFKDSMMSASMSGGAPKEIQTMLDNFNKPTIDWRSKIQRTMRSWIKNDSTFMISSRRTWANAFGSGSPNFYGSPIFPGLKPDEDIDICVALDASGSISPDMLKDFLTEVLGITQQFKQFKMRILTFDTSVYTVRNYTNGDEEEILKYPVKGGGGTDFDAVFKHMKDDNYIPKQLIMFTDGLPWNSWGDDSYCKTLFVIHSNPSITAPFGDTIHYEEEIKNNR